MTLLNGLKVPFSGIVLALAACVVPGLSAQSTPPPSAKADLVLTLEQVPGYEVPVGQVPIELRCRSAFSVSPPYEQFTTLMMAVGDRITVRNIPVGVLCSMLPSGLPAPPAGKRFVTAKKNGYFLPISAGPDNTIVTQIGLGQLRSIAVQVDFLGYDGSTVSGLAVALECKLPEDLETTPSSSFYVQTLSPAGSARFDAVPKEMDCQAGLSSGSMRWVNDGYFISRTEPGPVQAGATAAEPDRQRIVYVFEKEVPVSYTDVVADPGLIGLTFSTSLRCLRADGTQVTTMTPGPYDRPAQAGYRFPIHGIPYGAICRVHYTPGTPEPPPSYGFASMVTSGLENEPLMSATDYVLTHTLVRLVPISIRVRDVGPAPLPAKTTFSMVCPNTAKNGNFNGIYRAFSRGLDVVIQAGELPVGRWCNIYRITETPSSGGLFNLPTYTTVEPPIYSFVVASDLASQIIDIRVALDTDAGGGAFQIDTLSRWSAFLLIAVMLATGLIRLRLRPKP